MTLSSLKHKKVYILTVPAGTGHLRAADALKKAFTKLYPAWDVKIIDVLDYTNTWFKKFYPNSYVGVINKVPEFWGLLYRKTNTKKVSGKIAQVQHIFNKINAVRLIRYLKKYPPDLAICTHFLPAEILSSRKISKKIDFPWVCAITDFELHTFWVYPDADLYVVATEHTKFQLTKNGILSDKILPTGIPIDPVFAQKKSKNILMKEFGLKIKTRTILVMSGGFAIDSIENIVNQLQKIKSELQIIVVTGKNKELEKKLKKIKFIKPTKVFGFVNNIDELLTICDLLVSKSGGLTTSEALAKGVPMVVVNPIPGNEERNSDYLLENGAAIRVSKIDDIGFKIQSILKAEGKLDIMKQNAAHIGKPASAINAVKEIVKRIK